MTYGQKWVPGSLCRHSFPRFPERNLRTGDTSLGYTPFWGTVEVYRKGPMTVNFFSLGSSETSRNSHTQFKTLKSPSSPKDPPWDTFGDFVSVDQTPEPRLFHSDRLTPHWGRPPPVGGVVVRVKITYGTSKSNTKRLYRLNQFLQIQHSLSFSGCGNFTLFHSNFYSIVFGIPTFNSTRNVYRHWSFIHLVGPCSVMEVERNKTPEWLE